MGETISKDSPKIDLESDFERRWPEKSMKIASGAIVGSFFFALHRFFHDLGVRLGPQNELFGATFGRLSRLFGQLLGHTRFFFTCGCSGRIFGRFWMNLCVTLVVCGTLFCSNFVPSLSKFQITCCFTVGLALAGQPSVAWAVVAQRV